MSEVFKGKYIEAHCDSGYEFVRRSKGNGVVEIVAVIEEDGIEKILLTEQYRPPVGANVIENAAGLSGDKDGDEDLMQAAARECEEELGYRPGSMHFLTEGPTSAGLSDEMITMFLATDLEKVSEGGGAMDENENIKVIKIPLNNVHSFLMDSGCVVSPRIWAGLNLREEFLRRNKTNAS